MLTAPTNTGTYHDAVLAPHFIKARRVRLTLINRSDLFVCMFEHVKVVVVNIVTNEDIGDEFQD